MKASVGAFMCSNFDNILYCIFMSNIKAQQKSASFMHMRKTVISRHRLRIVYLDHFTVIYTCT